VDGGRTQRNGLILMKGKRKIMVESREMRNHKLNWMIILSREEMVLLKGRGKDLHLERRRL